MFSNFIKNKETIQFPLMIAGVGNTYKSTIAIIIALQKAYEQGGNCSVQFVANWSHFCFEQLILAVSRATGIDSQLIEGWLISNKINLNVSCEIDTSSADTKYIIIDEVVEYLWSKEYFSEDRSHIKYPTTIKNNVLKLLELTKDYDLLLVCPLRTNLVLFTGPGSPGQSLPHKRLDGVVKTTLVPACKSFINTSPLKTNSSFSNPKKIKTNNEFIKVLG
jgi:hypothetical protein